MTRAEFLARVADLRRQRDAIDQQIDEAYASLANAGDGALVIVLDMLPGAGRRERSAVARACKAGDIADAAYLSRRWRAPRENVLAWLRSLGPRLVAPPDAAGDDELEEVRRSLLRPAKAPAPRRARRRA